VLLGVAALVLSIITATRGPEPAPRPETPKAEPQELFDEGSDKTLCQAIGPLMKESDESKQAYQASGVPGSPERAAAMAKFKTDTLDWASRIQEVLNSHSEPPRYLTRTLQEYIDGMLLYTENIYPDRQPDSFDKVTWDSAVVAYGGPLGTCQKLGALW
jgi:hypothetical protein